jgi:hypothetical protein
VVRLSFIQSHHHRSFVESGRDESELNSALFVEYGHDLSEVTGEHGSMESLTIKVAKLSEERSYPSIQTAPHE